MLASIWYMYISRLWSNLSRINGQVDKIAGPFCRIYSTKTKYKVNNAHKDQENFLGTLYYYDNLLIHMLRLRCSLLISLNLETDFSYWSCTIHFSMIMFIIVKDNHLLPQLPSKRNESLTCLRQPGSCVWGPYTYTVINITNNQQSSSSSQGQNITTTYKT